MEPETPQAQQSKIKMPRERRAHGTGKLAEHQGVDAEGTATKRHGLRKYVKYS